jgi:pimeloyl-ACP methyl ester carboxylesterase
LEDHCSLLTWFRTNKVLSPDIIRSGQQAALASDLVALMDALSIEYAILAGYDWGGRAACIVAALFPGRVKGLISVSGYNIQNIAKYSEPTAPEIEMLNWYQYYFHSERGRLGLTRYRKELCRLLWSHWSPTWKFDDQTYEATAISFTNPDFVNVVVHSYRHRYGLVNGDPKFEYIRSSIIKTANNKNVHYRFRCQGDGVEPFEGTGKDAMHFVGNYERRIIKEVGHNVPQEAPGEFAGAIKAVT